MQEASDKYVMRTHSPELTAAAQAHADVLAKRGYGVYTDRNGRIIDLPNVHDGWGDGTPRSRAWAHGFTDLLSTPDIRTNRPGAGVTGEIIHCGTLTVEQAFASFAKHDTGHWIPLTSRSLDVAGFGHAINTSGQNIYVAMYGNSHVPSDHAQFGR